MLTKIKHIMRVQHLCTLQLRTVIITVLSCNVPGYLDVVHELVEVGADKDQAHNEGATPLYIAAQNGYHNRSELQCTRLS